MSKEVFNRYDSAAYLEAAAEVGEIILLSWPGQGPGKSIVAEA